MWCYGGTVPWWSVILCHRGMWCQGVFHRHLPSGSGQSLAGKGVNKAIGRVVRRDQLPGIFGAVD